MKAETGFDVSWCLGCGNYSILSAFRNLFSKNVILPENTVFVAGVGCHGKLPYGLAVKRFMGLHGRTLPVAQGVKLANPKLSVFAIAGDGDCFGEGGNHFIHACRRNIDITLVVHNNQNYALTTGQYTPLSPKGYKSKTSPEGIKELPLNAAQLAIVCGAGFVARTVSSNPIHVQEMIKQAVEFKGFAVVEILQYCPSFNPTIKDCKTKEVSPAGFYEALEHAEDLSAIGVFFKQARVEAR